MAPGDVPVPLGAVGEDVGLADLVEPATELVGLGLGRERGGGFEGEMWRPRWCVRWRDTSRARAPWARVARIWVEGAQPRAIDTRSTN